MIESGLLIRIQFSSWIRIRIRILNMNPDQDPGGTKRTNLNRKDVRKSEIVTLKSEK